MTKHAELSTEYTLVQTGRNSKSPTSSFHDDEALVDTTAPLTLISKKTKRQETQRIKKQSAKRGSSSLLDLPPEILLDILSWLRPSEIFRLLRVSHGLHNLISKNQNSIARTIVRRRYSILTRCFPLPVAALRVDANTISILLSPRRQNALGFHKVAYQHIAPINLFVACSCTWCIFCWNNLNLVLDLHHFQHNLDERIPIPIIPRGTDPAWNAKLLAKHSSLVKRAMHNPLVYAVILERHLDTIVGTITRKHDLPKQVKSASGKWMPSKRTISVSLYPDRPYGLTDREAGLGSDEFLERHGKPSYEFPYHRDNYYALDVYVPNRKWSKENQRWMYYDNQHDKDVALAVKWFGTPQIS